MAEGHGRDRWGRMSVLCALIANVHRDPKKGRAMKPQDFNPYEARSGEQIIEVDQDSIGLLRQAFVGRKGT